MKYLILLNVLAFALFLALRVVVPVFTAASVGMRYVELDRAGVINETALSEFDASFGFRENPRYTVPRYIGGPALSAETRNALLGAICSGANLLAAVLLAVRARRPANPVIASDSADPPGRRLVPRIGKTP